MQQTFSLQLLWLRFPRALPQASMGEPVGLHECDAGLPWEGLVECQIEPKVSGNHKGQIPPAVVPHFVEYGVPFLFSITQLFTKNNHPYSMPIRNNQRLHPRAQRALRILAQGTALGRLGHNIAG